MISFIIVMITMRIIRAMLTVIAMILKYFSILSVKLNAYNLIRGRSHDLWGAQSITARSSYGRY